MQKGELSALIGDIYDAALDPELWPGVLETCARFIGGSAAALFSKDAASKTGNAVYYCGIDPYYEQLYFERIVKLDPLTIGHYFAEIGEPVAVADILPYDEFLATRAYQEWGRPQGIVDTLNVALDKTATSAAFFAIFRHERDGLVDDEARHRMRLIAPHVRRAVLIGKVIEAKTEEAATLTDALDGINASMFLVDARGRIVHANAAGHAMLAEGAVLHAAGPKLAASDGEVDAALHEAFMAAGEGDAVLGVKGIAMPLEKPDGERYLAHVLPLSSGARRQAGVTYRAAAMLFVHKAALDTPSMPEVIAETYRLTPMELRVLLAIVEVGGVPEVAEALGSAETTVKTHLGRLYGKTGVRRQADLVKLVAGYSNPLVA
ncbi:MAG: helix-turn-helix transcriptional regulator [Methyloceanibacter sp.]|uniref:helix-turn-helix transcriptional regulator n=1 Tax=Methyloceanibacter sp. TaxID=1965321 RepID=UPI003D6CCC56